MAKKKQEATRDAVISINIVVEGYENNVEFVVPNIKGKLTGSQIARGDVESAMREGLEKVVGAFK